MEHLPTCRVRSSSRPSVCVSRLLACSLKGREGTRYELLAQPGSGVQFESQHRCSKAKIDRVMYICIFRYIHTQMDGWTGGLMGGLMGGWVDGWVDGWVGRGMDGWVGGWMGI